MRLRIVLAVAVLAVVLPAVPAQAASDCSVNGTFLPGHTEEVRCEVVNNSPAGATFYVFIERSSVVVTDEEGNVQTGAGRDEFLSFFRVRMATERILTADNPASSREQDNVDIARIPHPAFREACDEAFTDLFGDVGGDAPLDCRIGYVRAAGTRVVQNFDRREFTLALDMIDTGSDQSEYIGWGVSFSWVFRAAVGVPRDCPSSGCPPVYER
jgi:hypothetical protein